MADAPRQDAVVRGALVLTVAFSAVYVLRFLLHIPTRIFDFFDAYLVEPLLLGALIAVLLFRRGPEPRERRFWTWIAAAFGCWLVAALFIALFPGVQETTAAALFLDFLYLALYLAMVLSIEGGPHLDAVAAQRGPEHRIESIGAILFVFGLLGYFVLIPSTVNAEVYQTWIPSFYLYVALDLFVASRFAHAARRTRSPRWRAILGLLSGMALVWAVADTLEALLFADVLSYDTYTTASAIGFVSYFLVVLARRRPRVRSRALSGTEQAGPSPVEKLRGALVIYAYLFPLLHFALYGLDLLDPTSRPARELLVAIALTLMGILTVVQHVWLDIRNRRLQGELHRAATELRRSQRLEAIGRLAGGVAHDFNNLLTVIRASSDSTLRNVADPDQVRRHQETVRKASDQASGLTRQLLALGSRQFLEPELLDLNEVILDAETVIRSALGPRVRYRRELDDALGPVLVDRSQFHQVLLNMAVNARDAMPSGGCFTIETGSLETFGDQGRAGVAVRAVDTGSGMDPSTLEQAFDPFFSTKDSQGSGLGLATVYGIVKQSGGTIDVESRPGRGTRFTLSFPVSDAALPAERGVPSVDESVPDRATVLLVDDDDSVRELVLELLETDGYRVLEAGDGLQALRICEAHSGRIHLLLTDVVMPRMNGADLADRVRELRPETAILYMSGYVDDPESRIRFAMETGSLIRKPFSAEFILGEVGRAVRRGVSGV